MHVTVFTYVVVKLVIYMENFHFLFKLPSQPRNKTLPLTSQSLYYQSHPPSVSTRHQPVTASVPTSERFTSDYENISSLRPGPHTMNPRMCRRERNPPENSSHFRYSIYSDHGVSSMPYLHQLSTKHCHMIQYNGRNKQRVCEHTHFQMFCIAE